MKTTTASDLRSNMSQMLNSVMDDKEELVISRNNGGVVLVDLDEYNSLKETAYLLQSPANSRRLAESIEQLDGGRGEAHVEFL